MVFCTSFGIKANCILLIVSIDKFCGGRYNENSARRNRQRAADKKGLDFLI